MDFLVGYGFGKKQALVTAGLSSTQRSSGTNVGFGAASHVEGSPTLMPPTDIFSGPMASEAQFLLHPSQGRVGTSGMLLESEAQVCHPRCYDSSHLRYQEQQHTAEACKLSRLLESKTARGRFWQA